MKLKFLFLSILSLTAMVAGATQPSRSLPTTQPDASVPFFTTDDESEEQAVSFWEKASLTAIDNSPFAFVPQRSLTDAIANPLVDKMVDYAARFLGTRYRLGASGPSAFDCSGFTGWVYRHFGMNLDRTSRSQYTQGRSVNLNEIEPGDLLFFSSRSSGRRAVGHVAMVVSVDREAGTCEFIHASTKRGVTYQSFPDNGYYSRHFIGARRMMGTTVSANARIPEGI